MIPFPFNVER